MRKIPRLFLPSGKEDGTCSSEIDPQCYWVLNYGYPTRKFDGTCCMVRDGKLYARMQIKEKRLRKLRADNPAWQPLHVLLQAAPTGFEPFYFGNQRIYGWVPAETADNCNKHRLYLQQAGGIASWYEDGTYELCGPGVNGNHDRFKELQLVKHGAWGITDLDYRGMDSCVLYEVLKRYLTDHPFEGIVFKGPSGLYAKICRQHFGLEWPVQ